MTDVSRVCWNIKSRTHPDVLCGRPVVFKDYCSFHHKNPRRFIKPVALSRLSRRKAARLSRFIALCRIKIGLSTLRRQGIATYMPTLATNTTELITMDPLQTIFSPYRFSFKEGTALWLFDIRILHGKEENPYTSAPLSSSVLERICAHKQWLTHRHYSLIYPYDTEGPSNQKILDICYLLDSYGYLTNVKWFVMNKPVLERFVERINHIWATITLEQRRILYPSYTGGTLFSNIDNFHVKLLVLLHAATQREDRVLMGVYILMALTKVQESAHIAFPWL